MKTISGKISISELKSMASNLFGDLIKAVVDVEKGLLALDAELHSDLEAALLEDGSFQKDLWGINLYPEIEGEDFIEYDSMINVRPSSGNMSRGIDDDALRMKILHIVSERVEK